MQKTLKYSLISIIAILICVLILRFWENRNYKLKGGELIEKVEGFNKNKGRLPFSMEEFSDEDKMGEGPYYEKENDSVYNVYFSIGFDSSLMYSSSTKKWVYKP